LKRNPFRIATVAGGKIARRTGDVRATALDVRSTPSARLGSAPFRTED